MFYSTDCNYIVKIIGKDSYIECYTKEQLKNNIRHENGCIVYKVLNNGHLEKMSVIKPNKQEKESQQCKEKKQYYVPTCADLPTT